MLDRDEGHACVRVGKCDFDRLWFSVSCRSG